MSDICPDVGGDFCVSDVCPDDGGDFCMSDVCPSVGGDVVRPSDVFLFFRSDEVELFAGFCWRPRAAVGLIPGLRDTHLTLSLRLRMSSEGEGERRPMSKAEQRIKRG